jgi:hypothetical protein
MTDCTTTIALAVQQYDYIYVTVYNCTAERSHAGYECIHTLSSVYIYIYIYIGGGGGGREREQNEYRFFFFVKKNAEEKCVIRM